MLDQFLQEYTGKVVSFDKVPTNAGQSLQLIAQWCSYVGLPFQWASPYAWWDDSDDTFLEHWEKVVNDRKDGNQLPKAGDIVIFDTSLPGSGGKGHATIFIAAVGPNTWRGFDANWGGKSAHLQTHNWSYVLGWFTPRNSGAFEGNPTPIAEEAPSDSYEVQEIEPRSVTLKNDALLYNLRDVDWESFQQNVISQGKQGQDIIAVGIAKHRLGGTYYVPNLSLGQGYRVVDCDNHDRSQPEQAPPEEKIGENKKSRGPAAPLLQAFKRPITIEKEVPRYASMGDAINGINSTGTVEVGDYILYKQLEGMYCLAQEVNHPIGWWINPEDLLSEEEKLKLNWRTTYKPFRDQYGNVAPRYYAALNDDVIPDLEERRNDLAISRKQPILIRGWFLGPDGVWYGRPDACVNKELMWYGVKRNNLQRIADPTLAEIPQEEELLIEPEPLPSFRDKIVSILPPSVARVFDVVKPKI